MSAFLTRRTASAAASASPRLLQRSFTTTSPRPWAKITIVGNLADTPEVHNTSTGREIVRFAIASNHGPKENRHTSWFRITSFAPEGPRRDFLTSLPKGSTVLVQGDASMQTYQDGEGNNRQVLNILEREFEVVKHPQSHHDRASPAQSRDSA